ncbi:MAG: Gfo/Idh/MocA family oxidoreductase [Promethearchaeota archaeon]|nr:MAG: Gfo/Idh/MocA family oxidoreductase [Candidatus Lokiarchaeota archaeon]
MKKKRTAVVGAGWFGRAHLRNFDELSKLRGICDADGAKLENIRNNHQYDDVNLYKDVDSLIKNEEIDAVSVCTPPKYIPEISKKFANAGIDILMEKPMSLNIKDLKEFKKYENSIRIMPGFIELYNPVFEKLLNELPKIGEIYTIASKRVGLYPRREWQMGVILDLSIHDIYLQERIMNKNKILNAVGFKKSFKDSIHADAAFIIIDFGSAIGNIESNWLTPSKFRRMYVNGEMGGLMIDFISQKITLRTGENLEGEWPETKEITYTPIRSDEPLRREIYSFLYDKETLVSLDDGIRALEIALKIVNN